MKSYALALLAVLMAAATASADEQRYSYDNTLASCGCNGHSWKNGCCVREPSCCDHLWDGYGCNNHCCGMHLPLPIVPWHKMHMNAAPYQVPCVSLPKINLRRDCTDNCCNAAPACTNDHCTAASDCTGECGCRSNSFKSFVSHIQTRLHRGYHKCCGGCDEGCDSSCDCSGGIVGNESFEASPSGDVVPENEVPLPPAPMTEARDAKRESKKQDSKKDDKKKTDQTKDKENKTAGLWLFPNLSL